MYPVCLNISAHSILPLKAPGRGSVGKIQNFIINLNDSTQNIRQHNILDIFGK